MGNGRITRVVIPALGTTDQPGRVTRIAIPALGTTDQPGRVTRSVVSALGTTDEPAKVTRVALSVLVPIGFPGRVTRSVLAPLVSAAANATGRVSRVGLSVLVQSPPVITPQAPREVENGFDIANPQLVRDAGIADPPPLGQYQVNDRGDLAVDTRLQGVRKRILRRLMTFRDGFAHLPGYGAAQKVKGPVRPAEVESLAVEIRTQVEREPEVIRASVSVQELTESPGVVVVTVIAQTRFGLDVKASQAIDLRRTS